MSTPTLSEILKKALEITESAEKLDPDDNIYACLTIEWDAPRKLNCNHNGDDGIKARRFFMELKEQGAFELDPEANTSACGGGWWKAGDPRRIEIARAEELEKQK